MNSVKWTPPPPRARPLSVTIYRIGFTWLLKRGWFKSGRDPHFSPRTLIFETIADALEMPDGPLRESLAGEFHFSDDVCISTVAAAYNRLKEPTEEKLYPPQSMHP